MVKSFCGCFKLKVPCIVIASMRLVGYFIAILVYIVASFFFEDSLASENKENTENVSCIYFEGDDNDGGNDTLSTRFTFYCWLILELVIAVANIIFSYWFIRGAVSVKDMR